MTQKELLYVEDAIGHEKVIIDVCNYMLEELQDDELVSFISDEIKKHEELKNELMNMLEAKSNEWSNVYG